MSAIDKSEIVDAVDLEELASLIQALEIKIGSDEKGSLWRSINNVLEREKKEAIRTALEDVRNWIKNISRQRIKGDIQEYAEGRRDSYRLIVSYLDDILEVGSKEGAIQ